jgi:hypothetical protein
MNTNRLLTSAQLTAKLARTADARTRRAEMRARVGTEMSLGGSHHAVVREANRRLRAA